MDLLVLNQYFDTLQEMSTGNSKCIFLPAGESSMRSQILEARAADM